MNHEAKEGMRRSRNAIRRLLWQWGTTAMRIERLKKERDAFFEMANDARSRSLRTSTLTGMPRGGKSSDLSDIVAAAIEESERYAVQAERINAEIDDAMRLRNCIAECVAELPPLQEKVITYRYVDDHSWRYIAMKLTYDERHVRRIEESAVDAIGRMIEIHVS